MSEKVEFMRAVMKAHSWDNITTAQGITFRCPPEGPHRFIPLFDTKEQAVAWAEGEEHVMAVHLGDRTSE